MAKQTPEGKVKATVRKILDEFKVYYFSPAANGYGRVGIPDIICCVNGFFLAIECKAGKGTTTALQDRELNAINAAGGACLIINEANVESLRPVLRSLMQGANK